jgi:hypothetical protein
MPINIGHLGPGCHGAAVLRRLRDRSPVTAGTGCVHNCKGASWAERCETDASRAPGSRRAP